MFRTNSNCCEIPQNPHSTWNHHNIGVRIELRDLAFMKKRIKKNVSAHTHTHTQYLYTYIHIYIHAYIYVHIYIFITPFEKYNICGQLLYSILGNGSWMQYIHTRQQPISQCMFQGGILRPWKPCCLETHTIILSGMNWWRGAGLKV